MLQTRVAFGLALLCGSIVISGNQPVNVGAIHKDKNSQWADGSPMPLPEPKDGGGLLADGSPMPIPKPTKEVQVADGSPMPLPKPKEGSLVADGSPMPLPKPAERVIDQLIRTL
jgi:hypothetical protein